jgi:hypothetical protein
MNFHRFNGPLRVGALAISLGVLTMPAIAQTRPAGIAGSAGDESGSLSIQRNMPVSKSQRFRDYAIKQRHRRPAYTYSRPRVGGNDVRQGSVRCCWAAPRAASYRRYTWADIQGIRLLVRMP